MKNEAGPALLCPPVPELSAPSQVSIAVLTAGGGLQDELAELNALDALIEQGLKKFTFSPLFFSFFLFGFLSSEATLLLFVG